MLMIMKTYLRPVGIFVALLGTFFLFSIAQQPDSSENYPYFLTNIVCNSSRLPDACTIQGNGEVIVDPRLESYGSCFGAIREDNPCLKFSQNENDKIASTSYSPGRTGTLGYQLDGQLLFGNLDTGIMLIHLVHSLVAAMLSFFTFFTIQRRWRWAYLMSALTMMLIPENIHHIGSLAPIGLNKVASFNFLFLSLTWFMNREGPMKIKSSIFILLSCALIIGSRRADQAVQLFVLMCLISTIFFLLNFRQRVKDKRSSFVLILVPLFSFLAVFMSAGSNQGAATISSIVKTPAGNTNALSTGLVSEVAGIDAFQKLSSFPIIREVVALPYYLLLDLVPPFWSLSSGVVLVITLTIFVTYLGIFLRTNKKLRQSKHLLLSFISGLGVIGLLDVYGSVIGPRVEIRYIMMSIGLLVSTLYMANTDNEKVKRKRNTLILGCLVFLINGAGVVRYLSGATRVSIGNMDIDPLVVSLLAVATLGALIWGMATVSETELKIVSQGEARDNWTV
jgi:hypothetical protein